MIDNEWIEITYIKQLLLQINQPKVIALIA